MEDFTRLADLFESEDGDLFKPKPKKNVPNADDRLIESFNQITNFVKKYDYIPDKESDDIKEALLGARLLSIRSDSKKVDSLINFDELGLLELEKAPVSLDELFENGDDLFSEGVFNVDKLPNRGVVNKSVGDFAKRKACDDFDSLKSLFIEKQNGLKDGKYKLIKFLKQEDVVLGGFYVSDGQMCYVDEVGGRKNVFGRQKERLRVVYENGTESNVYLRTLSSQLYGDGYIVASSSYDYVDDLNDAVGYIYVLKSLSQDPKIQTIKDLYKIGVTNGTVSERIRNATSDPTYLMAPVELVDSYKLTGQYNPQKVESLIHRVFADAKVVMTIVDSYGLDYIPQEWYSVQINIINEVVDLINNGEIKNYYYDRSKQILVNLLNEAL